MPVAYKFEISPPERCRTYWFPPDDNEHEDWQAVQIEGVKEVIVSTSGFHRLKTDDGKLHIIKPHWLHIEIDADDWSA